MPDYKNLNVQLQHLGKVTVNIYMFMVKVTVQKIKTIKSNCCLAPGSGICWYFAEKAVIFGSLVVYFYLLHEICELSNFTVFCGLHTCSM